MRIIIKSLLYLSLIIISFSLSAQEKEISRSKIDSLETALTKTNDKLQKVIIWSHLTQIYGELDRDKCILYANRIIDYGLKEKNDTLLSQAYRGKGRALLDLGETIPAQEFLEKALETAQQSKSQKEIALSYSYLGILNNRLGNFEQALQKIQKGLQIARELGDLKIEANLENSYANAQSRMGNTEEAIKGYQKAIELNLKAKEYTQLAANYINLGNRYNDLSDYEKANQVYQKSLDVGEELKNPTAIADANQALGLNYVYLNKFTKALENLQAASKIYEDTKSNVELARTYTHLAILYSNLGDYTQLLEYYQKALKVLEKAGNKRGMITCYNNMGVACYEYLKDYPQALIYFQKVLEISQEMANKIYIGYAYESLGATYLKLNQLEKAFVYAEKSLPIAQEFEDNFLLLSSYKTLGEVYLKRKELNKALQYAQNAYDISESIDYTKDINTTAELLSRIYNQKQNYERAFYFHKIHKAASDSLFNQENVKKITTLENQYKFDQERAIDQLEQEKKESRLNAKIQQETTLRNAFIIGFILVLVSAFFILRSYLIKRKANIDLAEKNDLISLQAEELRVTNETLEELGQFKQEMTGMLVHDLKNPLNAIIGLTETQYQPKHYEAIRHSGQNMLNLVNNILDVQRFEEAKIQLHLTSTHFKNVCLQAYEQVAYLFKEKNIQFQVRISEGSNLDMDEELITRVMINLLSNAAKYTPNNGLVSIQEAYTEIPTPQIKIFVKDNGVGIAPELIPHVFDKYSQAEMPADIRAQSTGLGLTFCKLVIEAHQGTIGVESQLGQGSTFWFQLAANAASSSPSQEIIEKELNNITSQKIAFNKEEQQILLPLVEKIREHEVFEVSPIKAILKPLDSTPSEPITQWKQALEDSMYAGNEARFRELLNMFV